LINEKGHFAMQLKQLILLISLFISSYSTASAFQIDVPFKWQIGEELTYKVSWNFIRLGTLKLSIVDTSNINGVLTHQTKLKIDSNPWLFFVNMHSFFESFLMENAYPLLLICEEEIDSEEYNSQYMFDYDNKEIIVHYEGVENPDNSIDTTLVLKDKVQDGMSMIFYARQNCHRIERENKNVFYQAQEGVLDINLTGKIDSIEVSFIDDKVPAFYLNGEAHFTAIAGFGGAYEGWFSTDEQHVPLVGRMEVFVGSVYLELEEWENWSGNCINE
jgi:hypothetical protein